MKPWPTLGLLLLLVGCRGEPPSPPAAAQVPAPAETRMGDVIVRASTLPTMQLNEAMARSYGVERTEGSVLIVVGLRRESATGEKAIPGTVNATATDLFGRAQTITMHEVESAGYVDHVGVVPVSMPDTLRFRIRAQPQGAALATLEFHRDFFPPR